MEYLEQLEGLLQLGLLTLKLLEYEMIRKNTVMIVRCAISSYPIKQHLKLLQMILHHLRRHWFLHSLNQLVYCRSS